MGNQQYSFFFSDIAGYSKMVEQDEALAYRLLQEHNSIIENNVDENEGRVVKYIGDSVFAEFTSPDYACTAALAIQENFKKRNILSRKDEQIHIRLGIHSGEAIREEGDLFGNDINITSRIEGISQPDSIFISDVVLQNVKSASDYYSRKIDNVKLKNIHSPQTVHKLYPNKKEWEQESSAELAEALIETGVSFIEKNRIHNYDTNSIGILVFKCLDDPYYGYGLCNDLIFDFDRISQVYVADIQDVIRYKESELSPPDIARKLEVDNILDGVCSIVNNHIHLSIRMVSTKTGKTVWKEELRDLTANLNSLRGSIVKKVLDILDVKVPDFILEKMSTGMTDKPEAYKLYHEGLYKIEVIKKTDEYIVAKALFEKAIKYDNKFIESYAQQAITTFKMGHTEEAEELIDEALEKAEELNDEQGKAKLLHAMGFLNADSVKFKKAVKCFQKALAIYVKYEDQLAESKALNNLSHCYINLNEPDKGIEVLEKSIILKEKLEKDNLLGSSLAQLGNAYRNKFQYAKAISSYRKALGKFSRYNNEYHRGRVLLTLARCFCDIGLTEKARVYLQLSQEICSKFNEPLIMGRIKNYEAIILYIEKNYSDSMNAFEESLKIFRMGGLRKPIADLLREMMIIQIVNDNTNDIQKLLAEYKSESKVLADSDKYNGIIDCITYYMNVQNGTIQDLNLQDIENNLNDNDSLEDQYMSWWILSRAAGEDGDMPKEKHYYSKAIETINQLANKIGDDSYKISFLHKFPISEILVPSG